MKMGVLKKFLGFSFLVTIVSGSFSAHALDIVNEHGNSRIEVTRFQENTQTYISFKYCKAGETSCQVLGKKTAYTEKELKNQRSLERLQVATSPIALVAVSIGTGFVLSLAEAYFVQVILGNTMGYMPLVGIILGTPTAAYFYSKYIKVLSPSEQLRQARSLRSKLLEDGTITLKNEEDLFQFAKRLDLVLKKL